MLGGRQCHWPPVPLASAQGERCCQPAAVDDHSESPVWEREREREKAGVEDSILSSCLLKINESYKNQ